MEISIDTSGVFTVVRLNGELRAEQTHQVADEIDPCMQGRDTRVAIDLQEVPLIDSAGLSCLINCVTRARLGEGRVVLVGPTEFVRGVFEATQLDKWFEICPDLETAAERLAN